MTTKSEKQGELFFKVDARHVRQLGRELVADKLTALSELIKNAYDADATEVVAQFETTDRPGGSLVVMDNGTGMSLSDIQNSWMRISTAEKDHNPYSDRYRRPRAGRKGIGRFAAETLGSRLVLESQSATSGETIIVEFDWDASYVAGADLDSIPNRYRTSVQPGEAGTRLRIQPLHDSWSDDDLERVAIMVLTLQPPFPVTDSTGARNGDPGFRVGIVVDGKEATEEFGLEGFLRAATALIRGEVDEYGKGVWRVSSDLLDLDDSIVPDRRWSLVGPSKFSASYFVYRADALEGAAVALARRMGNLFGGVRLYRDGLRIMPYGQSDNDWLGLDQAYRRRTTELLFPIGNINFFGQVLISRLENEFLVDTASREGLIENEAFKQLQGFVREGLIWGARRVASRRSARPAPSIETGEEVPTRRALLDEAFDDAEAAIKGTVPEKYQARVLAKVRSVVKAAVDRAGRADKAEKEARRDLLQELDLLRILASLGTTVAVFSHEIGGSVNDARGAISDIADTLQELGSGPQGTEELEQASNAIDRLDQIGEYIASYVSRARRRDRAMQPLHDVLREFGSAFDRLLNRRQIRMDFQVVPAELRTIRMSRAELEAILFNLLTNAIKAMDPEGHPERGVRIVASREGADLVIRFQDTGIGIPKRDEDRIFEPFFTTASADQPELGFGTGLGLAIVRDIAESYGGAVSVGVADEGFTTSIDIRLPAAEPT